MHRQRLWIALALLVLGSPARGGQLTVDIVTDELDSGCVPNDCSLREALADADVDDTIDFLLPGMPPWTIRLAAGLGPLVVDVAGVEIDGPGADNLAISGDFDADGDGDQRVMRILEFASATIRDFTMRDGLPPTGSGRDGGCLWNQGTAEVVRARFENCRAWSAGPPICGNQPGGDGGAVFNGPGAHLEVESSFFVGNAAGTAENSLDCQTGMQGGSGGAIATRGDTNIRRSTFSGNRAGEGGEPNGPGGDGGALAVDDLFPIVIEESTFVDNRSGDGSGVGSPHGLDGHGGAIFTLGTLIMNNVTIHGNATGSLASQGRPSKGGGLVVRGGGELRNVTLTGNTALGEGGGLAHETSFLRMKHSIVAENDSGSSDADDCHTSALFISLGFNLIGVDAGCEGALLPTDLHGTPGDPLAPGLEPLAANGGPTQTREVQFSSVALDAGDPVTGCLSWDPITGADGPMPTDQRGEPRPVDGGPNGGADCDIGAYERAEPPPDFYLLTVSHFGSGDGTVTSDPLGIRCPFVCESFFAVGASVTLTADALPDSAFVGWGGDCSGASTCSVSMTEDREVEATFSLVFMLDVTVAGTGTVASEPAGIACPVDCTEEFLDETEVELTATPLNGAFFAGWSGDCSGNTPTCQLELTANLSATAAFVPFLIFADGLETGDTSRWSSVTP